MSDIQAALASETLSGAHHVATGLVEDQAQQLMQQAGSAFEGGIELVSWVAFSLALMAILIAWRTLRLPKSQPAECH
ncbi:hypothetical protein [Pseudomonas sp. P42]|uniref:hypothetical protein n=1 Tax=Pseudomonas sp. P42 TaxID=1080160 RepID=UPI001E6573AB|nr:hypothetical protein [Pseudomonas sp. P42]